MRILVTGSRGWSDEEAIGVAIQRYDPADGPTPTLVSGACRPRRHDDPPGADLLFEREATRLGWEVERHPARWALPCAADCPPGHRRVDRFGAEYCPWAGWRRNQFMADLGADVCLYADLGTRGTGDMLRRARRARIRCRPVLPAPLVPAPLEDAEPPA